MAGAGLLAGTTGEVCFAGPPSAIGLMGATGAAIGFTGPPSDVGFTGAASGVCFLTPPIELWAEAGRQKSPPNAAATMMMAMVTFFMGRSPEVLTQCIVNADDTCRCLHQHCPLLPRN
jgi:hypothetical protein